MSTAQFAFPLNVYARMLELDEGRLDYLHYGLFEHDDEPVWQAQERASKRLWGVLPPPCRVLEVGIGVGTTLRRLGEAGFSAFGITPDACQVAEVQARHGSAVRVVTSTLEALDAEHGPWDLMLLQESAQYIEPLALFEAADRLLVREGATLVVMDEFALQRHGPTHGGLHEHAHFMALAARMGWDCVVEHDVSAQAVGTVKAIRRLVQRQRGALLRELPVDARQLDALVDAGHRYQALYEQGVYGYRLLRLQRRARPALRLGAVGPAHAAAMRALFARVFERPMQQDEWQWKYGDGRGHAVGLWRGTDLVAHYGAASRAVLMDGRVQAACQVGDVMVQADANAGLGRQGALQQVSATLLENEIGWGRRHVVGFGFPNLRAMRVAERLGLYAPVDEVIQLDWPSAPARRWGDHGWRADETPLGTLQAGSQPWLHLQRLWEDMASALPRALLPVRDPAWVLHRYGRRPGIDYRLLFVRHRLHRRPVGALVLRHHGEHVELMDTIGRPSNFRRMLRVARIAAFEGGCARMQAWITASHADWFDDPTEPAQRVDIGVKVPTCIHTPGPAVADLRGRWFLMSGDTDFR